MKTNLLWDEEAKSIRGSFVNLFLTFSLMILIFAAVIIGSEKMVNSIKELQGLIVWFYGISYGVWSGKKVIESVWGASGVTTKINNTTTTEETK